MLRFSQIEPHLGELEEAYRHSVLRSDSAQIIFIISVSNIASLSLLHSDYLNFGFHHPFDELLILRILLLMIGIADIVILRKTGRTQAHDWAVATFMLAGAFSNIYIGYIYPSNYTEYAIVSIVLLNIYYFAIPSPLLLRASISIFLSASIVWLAYQSSLSQLDQSIILGMHILTNIIGIMVSTRLYTYRRLQFKARAEEKQAREELQKLADTDPLTGVNNRRSFFRRALLEFSRATRYHRPLSVVVMDIDCLKRINDAYGHQAGDKVIHYFTQTVIQRIRTEDILGRLGGDEFGILLPETNLSQAMRLGNRIREQCDKTVLAIDRNEIRFTISIGIAGRLDEDLSLDKLHKRADKMLYKAKEKGRNQVVVDSI